MFSPSGGIEDREPVLEQLAVVDEGGLHGLRPHAGHGADRDLVDVFHRLDAGPVPAAPVDPDEVLDAQRVELVVAAGERQPPAVRTGGGELGDDRWRRRPPARG